MYGLKTKDKNNFLSLLLILKFAEYKKSADSLSEILLFLAKYSFLFQNLLIESDLCEAEISQLYIAQENREIGARYLDSKYSLWKSTDPALGEYIPKAPVNEQAKQYNQNLPGMGGIFNPINANLYHYAGNNPVRYVDPDGRFDIDEQRGTGIVQRGDTFNSIYYAYARDGVSREEFAQANNIANMDIIIVGQEIKYDFNSAESDNDMLLANGIEMKNHYLNILFFAKAVRTGGVWDFKDINNSNHRAFYWFDGNLVTAEEYGNIHYGYVGAAGGFPTVLLIDAPGIVQVKNNTAKPSYWPTNFDDPRDTKNILSGIAFYKGNLINRVSRGFLDSMYVGSGLSLLFRVITASYYGAKNIMED